MAGIRDVFGLPLETKMRARRRAGSVAGYAAAHADRFTTRLPWKETLSFGYGGRADPAVGDYFAGTFGTDFLKLGMAYEDYCGELKSLAMVIVELLAVSLGMDAGSYCDFFDDASCIMRLNFYPLCPEPEKTLGTGPHCDPAALTILQQDAVDGLQVLADDGEWRVVRPVPGALVVIIGDTFMALCNGQYRSCVHRAAVNRHCERRSLAFFLCPAGDRMVRPPHSGGNVRRLYPDFTWTEFMRFTQCHRRADADEPRTLDAFVEWRRRQSPDGEPTN